MAKSKKPTAKSKSESKPASPAVPQVVDPARAAAAAAALVARGIATAPAAPPDASAPAAESTGFRHLKQSLSKPQLGGLLDKIAPSTPRKSIMPNANQQVGHNQTFGADVSRKNLPRRTGG